MLRSTFLKSAFALVGDGRAWRLTASPAARPRPTPPAAAAATTASAKSAAAPTARAKAAAATGTCTDCKCTDCGCGSAAAASSSRTSACRRAFVQRVLSERPPAAPAAEGRLSLRRSRGILAP